MQRSIETRRKIGISNSKTYDLSNKRFGKLTAITKLVVGYENNRTKWLCKCDCGEETEVGTNNLLSGNTKSCGCLSERNPGKRKRPYEWVYNGLLRVSNKNSRTVNLSYDQFVEFTHTTKCHYCCSDIEWVKFNGRSGYHLDRKDPSIGYSKENCVVCCTRCNFGKTNRYSYDEWYGMTKYFRKD